MIFLFLIIFIVFPIRHTIMDIQKQNEMLNKMDVLVQTAIYDEDIIHTICAYTHIYDVLSNPHYIHTSQTGYTHYQVVFKAFLIDIHSLYYNLIYIPDKIPEVKDFDGTIRRIEIMYMYLGRVQTGSFKDAMHKYANRYIRKYIRNSHAVRIYTMGMFILSRVSSPFSGLCDDILLTMVSMMTGVVIKGFGIKKSPLDCEETLYLLLMQIKMIDNMKKATIK